MGSPKKSSWLAKLTFDHESKAQSFLDGGDKAKAAKAFARGGNLRKAARYYAEAGDERKAVELAFKAVLGPKANFQEGSTPKQAGELLATAGAHADAVPLFELGKAYQQAARSALKSGQKARAGTLFDRAKEWPKAATCYEQAGRLRDALRVLDLEILRLQSGSTGKHDLSRVERKRADILSKLGRSGQAADVMRKAGAASQSAPMLEQAGKIAEAIEAYVAARQFDDALRLARERNDLDRKLVPDILRDAGRFEQAAKLYGALGFSRDGAEAYEQAGKWLPAASLWNSSREPVRAAEAFFSRTVESGRPRGCSSRPARSIARSRPIARLVTMSARPAAC